MTASDIKKTIIETAEEVFELDPEELDDDPHFDDELNVTSVIRLEYLVTLERRLGVRFGREVESMQRLSELVVAAQQLIMAKTAAA